MTNNTQKQYNNNQPPWKDKAWQYNQFNSIADRFKAMGWTPPSEQRKDITK